jgi:outer membrane receptor for ferrienterochelin and colicin
VVVRRIGYGPLTVQIAIAARQTLERRIVLHKAVTLDSVVVTAAGGIPAFEEHRKAGVGHFLTRADLEKHAGRLLSDVLAQIPGVGVVRGSGRSAWVIARRGARSLQGSNRLDSADSAMGAQSGACYSRVFLDNASVYRGDRDGESLFDINSVSPDQIEAIEFYTGPAQIPLRYSNVSTVCGVLVLHTRRR